MLQWGHGISAVEIISGLTCVRDGVQLQWGHGISAVEMEAWRRALQEMDDLLQWGHGISAVEIRPSGVGLRRGRRFNGATAFLPWKWPRLLMGYTSRSSLQWGHGISAVEISHTPLRQTSQAIASMGPRHFCRGNLEAMQRIKAWMTGLQWGHGISAVEIGEVGHVY